MSEIQVNILRASQCSSLVPPDRSSETIAWSRQAWYHTTRTRTSKVATRHGQSIGHGPTDHHNIQEPAHLDGDLVVEEREELLAEPVPVLFLPLLRQEADDVLAAVEKGATVAPDGVRLSGSKEVM